MSPRVVPKQKRSAEGDLVNEIVRRQALQRQGRCTSVTPYTPTCGHSYFRDRLLDAESEALKPYVLPITNPIRKRDYSRRPESLVTWKSVGCPLWSPVHLVGWRMRLYALVEAGDPEAIDVYLCEQGAQRRSRTA